MVSSKSNAYKRSILVSENHLAKEPKAVWERTFYKWDLHHTSYSYNVTGWVSTACIAVEDCNPTPDGSQYTGHTRVTVSGKQCQKWASQSPHEHSYKQNNMFPDGDVNDASNYCRNPSGYSGGLWCYTMDSDTRWEACSVPDCGQSLRYIEWKIVEIKCYFTPSDHHRPTRTDMGQLFTSELNTRLYKVSNFSHF